MLYFCQAKMNDQFYFDLPFQLNLILLATSEVKIKTRGKMQ